MKLYKLNQMFFTRRIPSTIPCIRTYSLDLANENKSFENKFTAVEKERILTTLNSSNSDALSKFNITQARLKNLINWKNKKGPFTTLSDVLEVDGLGINILDKLCQSILSNEEIDSSKQKNLINKSKKNILLPNLNKKEIDNLTSAVGLHIESTGISWAKLQTKNNELVSWSYSNFSTLPKKVLPVDTFSLAMRIVHSIPPADVYILESKQSTGPNRNQSKATPYTHQLELTSMLIALLNTHHECNLHNNATPADLYPNRVYYLRNRLPARLFGALVGTERVSIENTILSIITGATNTSLPCSRLTIDPVLIDNYYKCLKGYKDLLGQALLLVITFMELCVYNNPAGLKLIRK